MEGAARIRPDRGDPKRVLRLRLAGCRVHFVRKVISNAQKTAGPLVASITRTIFAQPDTEHVHSQFDEVVCMVTRFHPRITEMLDYARDDLFAFAGFPTANWRQICSTNPLERVNKEIEIRTDVVGPFLNLAALLRLGRSRPHRATRRTRRRRPPLLQRTLDEASH